MTLASSCGTLPDDGDYTETCWSIFNVNFNTPFKAFSFVSVGNKTLINANIFFPYIHTCEVDTYGSKNYRVNCKWQSLLRKSETNMTNIILTHY